MLTVETSGKRSSSAGAGSRETPGTGPTQRRADAPTNEAGAQYHLHLAAGQIPDTILMPGDPGRVELMRATWEGGQELAFHREYRSARGTYKDVPIGAISSGVGAPSLEIATQEFATIGGKTVIRVGTTGALNAGIHCGDLIVPAAAVRRDGTSDRYLTPEHPAFADPEVFMALVEACERLGYRYHVGIVCSVSSFYAGQERPVAGGFWRTGADGLIDDLRRAGVDCLEMECSALFVLARLFGMRSGAILGAVANRETNEFGDNGAEGRAIAAANEAVAILDEWRVLKQAAGKTNFFPSLLTRG
jgi:uridine phosphorylase